jgi:hypothetical protein
MYAVLTDLPLALLMSAPAIAVFVAALMLTFLYPTLCAWWSNLRAPDHATPARIEYKRVEERQGSGWEPATLYVVGFRLDNGACREFTVSDSDYHRLREGQQGSLRMRGAWYRGFAAR